MSRVTRIATARGSRPLFTAGASAAPPVSPPAVSPVHLSDGPGLFSSPGGPWEVEIGFGKGRYLLRRAVLEPGGRFLGIEIAGEYFRLVARRVARRRLENVVLLAGEAQYLAGAVLPRGFARAVHIYFPDPWPKLRHQRRRLFAPESIDLVLGLLVPRGMLYFATDFLVYGAEVHRLLASHPGVRVCVRETPWPDGARTNYESKYMAEGRPILRLEVEFAGEALPHPAGLRDLVVALPRMS